MTGCHLGPKQKLRAAHRAPSLKRTFDLASSSVSDVLVFVIKCKRCQIFRRREWYRALSLHYTCIWGIILIA